MDKMKLQQLLSLTRQAVDDYEMIDEGDKIAIGISGGKDSLTLLYALSHLKAFYPKHFDLVGITVDVGFSNIDFSSIQNLCDSLQIPYHIIRTQIAQIVFDAREDKNPCSLCSRMRKGAMNAAIRELGCNKVAFAHHKDDLLESMMMSLLFEGRLHTFSPVTHWDRTDLTLIRPLIYMYEGDVKGFVREMDLPVVKNPCPADGSTKREYAKKVINQMNHDHPGSKARMFRAVMEGIVNPDCPPAR